MNIALHGTGRMGQAVEALLRESGHAVCARFNRQHPIEAAALKNCEVIVDFSHAEAIPRLVEAALAVGIPVVSGTTGWDDRLQAIRQLIECGGGAMLVASNFSIGMALFRRLVSEAAKLFGRLEGYDFGIHEVHHSGKQDHPSGTARMLGTDLLTHLPGKSALLLGNPSDRVQPGELQITSGRIGSVFGIHQVWIDHADETIQLVHQAKSRALFARGALLAAQWLSGKRGFFTFDDFVNDLIHQNERDGHGG